jgi:3-methyl-2-oxobutanoate hydroxymethyltransferase
MSSGMSQPDEVAAPYGTGPARAASPVKRVRTHHLRQFKERGEKFSMLTAYEQYAAATFDEAGIDVLLPLTRAVSRSVSRALVVGDLPFGSYQGSPEQAYATAARFMKEGLAHCVKLEGGVEMAPQITRLSHGGIPVMAHIGFTPQSEHALGGPRVQGRGDASERVLADAHAVQDAGAFAVVMEMVPGDVAAQVTKELVIPTIGIGAGVECDGQVLVWQDAFGLRTGRMASFVKQYADLHGELLRAARAYDEDVKAGTFPGPDQTF